MIKRATVFMALICTALMLAGCGTYVPEGATVVSVKNARQEFDRAVLRPENQLQGGGLGIRMKWYDTNTYITTATLSPGNYKFQAHSYDGGGVSRQIKITDDKHFYEIDAAGEASESAKSDENEARVQTGPALKGRLNLIGQRAPSQVEVLFIGQNIIMKKAPVAGDGSFSTTFPENGTWRVEVHATGNPPHSYVHSIMNVSGPIDLGMIALK